MALLIFTEGGVNMYYGIKPLSLRRKEYVIVESENSLELFNQFCTGVFTNKSDAEWVLEMIMKEGLNK